MLLTSVLSMLLAISLVLAVQPSLVLEPSMVQHCPVDHSLVALSRVAPSPVVPMQQAAPLLRAITRQQLVPAVPLMSVMAAIHFSLLLMLVALAIFPISITSLLREISHSLPSPLLVL